MAPKNKRPKLELVFDPKEREAFLTGFSKRKQARKKAARDDIERQYKEEVARIKKDRRETMLRRLEEVSNLKRSNGMELIQLAQNELDKEKVLDLPQHVVTITSTEELDLTKCSDDAFLGANSSTPAVEVIDTTKIDGSDDENGSEHEAAVPETQGNKSMSAKGKSVAKAAALARKSQMLKAKKPNQKAIGKMSKSQKKFLRKHKHKPKAKPSR